VIELNGRLREDPPPRQVVERRARRLPPAAHRKREGTLGRARRDLVADRQEAVEATLPGEIEVGIDLVRVEGRCGPS
jgi:hypothetical protein